MTSPVDNTTAIGLLKYSQSKNLGDATQSLAALYCWWDALGRPEINFWCALQKVVTQNRLAEYHIVWLDRDRMSESATSLPSNITRVVTICNGWWMHEFKGRPGFIDFPLPSFVVPLFTSVHITIKSMLTADAVTYFKLHEPIGCRDYYTTNLLGSLGIKSYFSGCLTTCIDLSVIREGAEGQFDRLQDKIANIDIMSIGHYNFRVAQLLSSMSLPPSRSMAARDNYLYQSQMLDHSMESPSCLVESAQSLLELQNASIIFTTRLHVWLPLLFNNCNVKLLNPEKLYREIQEGDRDFAYHKSNRFGGNLELRAMLPKARDDWRTLLRTKTAEDALKLLPGTVNVL